MTASPIILPHSLYLQMCTLAEASLPYEACGLLSGSQTRIKQIFSLPNQARSRHQFYVDASQVDLSFKKIHNASETVIAIFHTHPSSAAIPSRADIVYHPYPEIKMIILSLKKEPYQVNCFNIAKPNYQPYPLQIKGRCHHESTKSN